MTNRWIWILSGLLAMQLVLAVAVNLTRDDFGAFQADEKLLSFDANELDGLRIEDGTDSVVLSKREGRWRLPDSGDFPASQSRVERLLDTLGTLEKGWPVARTRGAAQRFQVAGEQFERKLVLLSGDQPRATLYVGASPGFRKVYVRPGGGDDIFTVAFNTWDAEARVDDWIDKDALAFNERAVERIEMPGVTLQREDGELRVTDLGEQEQTDGEESRALLGRLAGLRIQSLLGTEAVPAYRQDEPTLEVGITLAGGEVLSYRFSQAEDAAYYVLKRSDLDHYFKVAEPAVESIRETTRQQLVQARTEAAPAAASGEN
ncbi:MAG: DUF4340 domain-containing protein [Gammaproteobacteria bacterium]|nr:MAG: DUF4340 domain-containing protein [Gammaproteobacteria bacterium]